MKNAKDGRPRQIDFVPYPGAKDGGIGYIIAILDEASERVIDQIEDLPIDALSFVPEGSYLSIGKLVLHQIQDEARCASKVTGCPVPEEFQKELESGGRESLGEPLDPPKSAGELITLCRRLREEFTVALNRKADQRQVVKLSGTVDGLQADLKELAPTLERTSKAMTNVVTLLDKNFTRVDNSFARLKDDFIIPR